MGFLGEIRTFSSLVYIGFASIIGVIIVMWIVKKAMVTIQLKRSVARRLKKIGENDEINASGGRKNRG